MESGVFDEIVVSSDWNKAMAFAQGLDHKIERPAELCTDESHDYQWVKHAIDNYPGYDLFAILRPTNPFRTADTIRRAFAEFNPSYDSLRAIEPTKHHPYKSWTIQAGRISPLIPEIGVYGGSLIDAFDLPTQLLPELYCQNGCIHIAYTAVLEKFKNVTGNRIKPFFTFGNEGIDINTPQDLEYAEWIMRGRP